MKIVPIDINEIDFSIYGEHRRLSEAKDIYENEHYTCYVDYSKFISGDWMMGYVEADILPPQCVKMEKHKKDKSLMICGDKPMILPLAPAGNPADENEEISGEVVAVVMYPGDVALLNEGVWHDACYGIDCSVKYYFMSKVYDTDIVVKKLKCPVEIGDTSKLCT